jgi:hypothetical protein
MKIMEISVRNVQTQRALDGLMKIIAALRLNMVKIPSRDALPYKMFMYGMPYEASRTFRTIRDEFENNKSSAAIETRQALCRC